MHPLKKKLNSQRGASILLALLLFLLCLMVASSILAAAVSNAGKIKSNRVEQQKYLTLSSAIRLVCNALEQARYTGRYTVYEWTEGGIDRFWCEQQPGEYKGGPLAQSGGTTDLVPLQNELDAVFAAQFQTGTPPANRLGYQALTGLPSAQPHFLTVTLPGGLKDYPATGSLPYQIQDKVTVRILLDQTTGHIRVTAWLGEGKTDADGKPIPPDNASDTITAELVIKLGTSPVLNYSPAGRTAAASAPAAGITPTPLEQPVDTSPAAWELSWMKKGAL